MVIVYKISDNTKQKMVEYYEDKKREKTPPYAVFQAEEAGTIITLYESGKVMFQGISADIDANMWRDMEAHLNNGKMPIEKKNKEKSVMFLTDEIQNFRQSLVELADSIIDKLTLDKVIEEIEKLPYELKMPFMLHFVRGLTCRQIGLLMNIKEQTVRQRICRIRKIIAEALKGVIFDD